MERIKAILLSLLALLLLSGCITERVVTKTEYKDRVEYRDRVERDTVITRDSVYIREKGDTVYISRYKYVYKDRVRLDTAYVSRVDSVPYPVYIEAQLTKWQQAKMSAGGYVFGAIVLLILYLAYKILK